MISRFAWLGAVMVALTFCAAASAQTTVLKEVRTVSSGSDPVERALEIPSAGAYRLTLTDLQVPVPLTSVKAAITNDTTLVGMTATTATNATGTLDFDATAGTFTIRLVGRPVAGTSGSVGVRVTRPSDSAVIKQFVVTFSPPSAEPPANRGTLVTTFTPSATANYQVTLSDLGVPEPIPNVILSVTRVGGSIVATLGAAGTTSFNGEAGVDYQVVADAMADTNVNAGLFGVRIRNTASGSVDFNQIVTIGRVQEIGKVTLNAGAHTLTLADLAFPAPLVQSGVALAKDGQVAATRATPGTQNFTAVSGEHLIYALATAAPSSAGSYGIEVKAQNGAAAFSAVNAVNGEVASPTGTAGFNYVVDIATAGAYRVRLADFKFPGELAGARLAAAQNGVVLGSIDTPGTLNLANVAVGRLFLVVLTRPPATGTGGLFGVDVAPGAGGSNVFEVTQGVGLVSTSKKLPVPAAAKYRVSVTDLKFPVAFAQFSSIVTRGADASVAIFGADQFNFDATPGEYLINFIAKTNDTEKAGTYGLNVALLPAAPTVTLTATPAQATVGGTVKLDWSSTDATTCTASDGWSGTKQTSGTDTSPAITASTTFTLKCEGPGGSGTKAITVNAVTSAQSDRSGGGGGALDWLALLALTLACSSRGRRQKSRLLPPEAQALSAKAPQANFAN